MAKVWCATLECEYNKRNKCTAKEINLSDGHVHTVHQGYLQIWKCEAFAMSREAREMYEDLRKVDGDNNER